jgi:hypothetical protein
LCLLGKDFVSVCKAVSTTSFRIFVWHVPSPQMVPSCGGMTCYG